MTAAPLDLAILQGATFRRQFEWRESDGVTPIDLTGATARMQVRRKLRTPDFMLEATTENGLLALGGTTGTIDLHFSAEDTDKLVGNGVYDLEIEFVGGPVVRILEGDVTVSLNVTRGDDD